VHILLLLWVVIRRLDPNLRAAVDTPVINYLLLIAVNNQSSPLVRGALQSVITPYLCLRSANASNYSTLITFSLSSTHT